MRPTPVMQSAVGPEVVIDGRKLLYFAGTAYLGLQGHPEVIRAGVEAMERYGVGAATTRAGFGHHPPTLEVEAAAAAYFGQPAAFYFPSGYSGPSVLLGALGDAFDLVFVDEQAHYAVTDALKAAGKSCFVFAHRDAADLRKKMQGEMRATRRPLVISDGVFAATGRVAPVLEYLDVLRNTPGAILALDDAHGVGVLGPQGRGTFDHFDIPADHSNNPRSARTGPRLYWCATLSKALGGYGGIIAGEAAWVERVKAVSRLYAGCGGPPPAVAAASAKALSIAAKEPSLRDRLTGNAKRLRAGLLRIGLDVEEAPTPVVPLDLGEGRIMARVQQRLMDQGIAIAHLNYAGTSDQGLLRLAVSAGHTPEMIDQLIGKLREAL